MKHLNLKLNFQQIVNILAPDYTGTVVDKEGNTYYLRDRQLHREDGPAAFRINGNQTWYKNGLKHREDGPAVEFSDNSDDNQYFYEGKNCTENQLTVLVREKKLEAFINGNNKV